MYKAIKTKIKNNRLKNRLIHEKTFFDEESLCFSAANVLVVDEIIPEFNKDSGSNRLTELIKLLLKNGVSVFLVADLKQYKYKSAYLDHFKALGVYVYEPSVSKSGSLITKELFIEIIAPKINYAWLHRPQIFKKYYPIVKGFNSEVKIIFDMVDFHYVRLMREYELTGDKSLKKLSETFLKIEIDNCKKADLIIAITLKDKDYLKAHFNEDKKVKVISNLHQHKADNLKAKSFGERKDLLFVGGFMHKPNIDAVVYLKENIMPIIWKTHPHINVNVVGGFVNDTIQALHSPSFKILGFVEFIEDYFNSSKVFVAPLRFGAGIKGKIGQALEFSLPLVTTPIGEEGFDFLEFQSVMTTNDEIAFAKAVIQLYDNEALWTKTSAFCKTILTPFSLEESEKQLLKIVDVVN